jgi:hypothetical protein
MREKIDAELAAMRFYLFICIYFTIYYYYLHFCSLSFSNPAQEAEERRIRMAQ